MRQIYKCVLKILKKNPDLTQVRSKRHQVLCHLAGREMTTDNKI